MPDKRLDELCINTIRMLSVDMVEKAKSGHPGMPLGAAPMAYALWTKLLRFNPNNPLWPDRDRFVLSAGHGSALLYALLHLTGYDLTLDDLKSFRQWGSKTPGHPERGVTPGVEVTTGPLGQGFANAVGMAMAERRLAAHFNRPGFDIVNHHTYAICSDGDLMEGVASEAASIAGHLRLGRLVCIYDDNGITLSGSTQMTFSEDVGKRFEAYGWHVERVEDGNDAAEVESAVNKALDEDTRPSLVMVHTHIGYGSPHMQDTFEAHGSPLGPVETAATKENLGWPIEPAFHIPEEAAARFREAGLRGADLESGWLALLKSYEEKFPELYKAWEDVTGDGLPEGWDSAVPVFPADTLGISTRAAGGKVLNALGARPTLFFGGSADMDPSTMTALAGMGSFQPPAAGDEKVQGSQEGGWNYGGSNVAFGVREHAMGAVLNGMAAHGGVIAYGSTFLIFSDYMRPAIRLAALGRLRVIYIFTHDSVALGEDGPTHQPVEHLASLRAMPGLTVIRPSDANETAEAWRAALATGDGPVALILSRQGLPVLDRNRYAPADGLHKGAYVLMDPPDGEPEALVIATGSEVHAALGAQEVLAAEGVRTRVVSMPSWELFEGQTQDYKDRVLPPGMTRRVSVEAGASQGWHRYVGPAGVVIGIDRFGASAPGRVNMEKFGFTAGKVAKAVRGLVSR